MAELNLNPGKHLLYLKRFCNVIICPTGKKPDFSSNPSLAVRTITGVLPCFRIWASTSSPEIPGSIRSNRIKEKPALSIWNSILASVPEKACTVSYPAFCNAVYKRLLISVSSSTIRILFFCSIFLILPFSDLNNIILHFYNYVQNSFDIILPPRLHMLYIVLILLTYAISCVNIILYLSFCAVPSWESGPFIQKHMQFKFGKSCHYTAVLYGAIMALFYFNLF